MVLKLTHGAGSGKPLSTMLEMLNLAGPMQPWRLHKPGVNFPIETFP